MYTYTIKYRQSAPTHVTPGPPKFLRLKHSDHQHALCGSTTMYPPPSLFYRSSTEEGGGEGGGARSGGTLRYMHVMYLFHSAFESSGRAGVWLRGW